MSGLLEHRDEWLTLADEQDRRADWDANARPAAKHKAAAVLQPYERLARASDRAMGPGFEPISHHWLCDLCAATMTSTAVLQYPDQYQGQAQTMQTLCYVGNAILAAIANLQDPTK